MPIDYSAASSVSSSASPETNEPILATTSSAFISAFILAGIAKSFPHT